MMGDIRETSVRSSVFALWLLALGAGCGIDRDSHPAYGKQCEGERYRGFCLDSEPGTDSGASSEDAGSGPADGGGHDAGSDASVVTPCSEEGKVELCYDDFEDPLIALQPPCRAGSRTCENGVWSPCMGQKLPKSELCNEEDDDCDGQIDEEQIASSCAVADQAGICAQGVNICVGGEEKCFQVRYAGAETCDEDGDDEDCDDLDDADDPDLTHACFDGASGCTSDGQGGYTCQGVCAAGTQRCIAGAFEVDCSNDTEPTDEIQNGLDEDCDSEVDENFPCEPDQSYACYTGPAKTREVAPCHEGTQICVSTDTGTEFGACENQQLPQPESCANNGVDNDCDGNLDDVPNLGLPCDDIGSTNVCVANSVWKCVGTSIQCVPGQAQPSEVCDGRDNDCDGPIDEGFNFQTDENHCGGCNIRCGSGLTCCGGTCVNTTSSNAHCGGCGDACGSGLSCCESQCVNTNTNSSYCGSCDSDCSILLPLLQTKCENGTCKGLL